MNVDSMAGERPTEPSTAPPTAPFLPLQGATLATLGAGTGPAASYAAQLLSYLGVWALQGPSSPTLKVSPLCADDSRHDWALSGAMSLSGLRDGPPRGDGAALASALRGALLAFDTVANAAGFVPPRLNVGLLGERADVAHLSRGGSHSVGGATRLIRARDGWCAFSLPRPDDAVLLAALIEDGGVEDPWARLTEWVGGEYAENAVTRAQLLGLAAAVVPGYDHLTDEQLRARWQGRKPLPFVVRHQGHGGRVQKRPLVVDLSALWAGPLCSSLLALAGARVVKVESPRRPDGARGGSPKFFDLLNNRKESVVLDLHTPFGRDALRRLLVQADVVIESSRPRALIQLGIDADEILAAPGSRTWVSITAYGRSGPWSNRVGFGDDVAAAAGAVSSEDGATFFWGDAIADPLTGVHAALAAIACLATNGSFMVDIAMREVVLTALATNRPPPGITIRRDGVWWTETGIGLTAVRSAYARPSLRRAERLGASTAFVLEEIGLSAP